MWQINNFIRVDISKFCIFILLFDWLYFYAIRMCLLYILIFQLLYVEKNFRVLFSCWLVIQPWYFFNSYYLVD